MVINETLDRYKWTQKCDFILCFIYENPSELTHNLHEIVAVPQATSYEASITHKQVPARQRDGQQYQAKQKTKPGQTKTFKHYQWAIYKVWNQF